MIELNYPGKKSKDEILSLIDRNRALPELDGNLLLFGDNLETMGLLLEQFRNKIDLVYIDPPFNTSNSFHSGKDRVSTISSSKDDEIAYKDNLPKEEFIEFLRERLILLHELLSPVGSLYLHIDYKIGHYVKIILDEIFGEDNFKNDIARIKSNPKNFQRRAYGNQKDLILFYSKNKQSNIWNNITIPISEEELSKRFTKKTEDGRYYNTVPLHAPGESKGGATSGPWRGMMPPKGRHWRTSPEEFDRLDAQGLIEWSSTGNPRIIKFADQHKGDKIQDVWVFKDPPYPIYPTEKNIDLLDQIVKQSSLPNSIVLDCFAGGGTTLKAAARNGRRWIGIDQSEVSIRTIKSTINSDYTFVDISKMIVEKVVVETNSVEVPTNNTSKKRSSKKNHSSDTTDKPTKNRQLDDWQ